MHISFKKTVFFLDVFRSHAATYMKTRNAYEEQQWKEKSMEIYHESVQLAFVSQSTTDPVDRYRDGDFVMKFVICA